MVVPAEAEAEEEDEPEETVLWQRKKRRQLNYDNWQSKKWFRNSTYNWGRHHGSYFHDYDDYQWTYNATYRRYVRNRPEEVEEEEDIDKDVIQRVLGYLKPAYSRNPRHIDPNDFENGEPYGGLRLWSPRRHLYLQRNLSAVPSIKKRWQDRGEEKPKEEW
jgi:hypothetical protein